MNVYILIKKSKHFLAMVKTPELVVILFFFSRYAQEINMKS